MDIATLGKVELDRYPKLNPINKDKESSCIVPFIENKGDTPNKSDIKKMNYCVPDDLVLALKQAEVPKEYLGPPSKLTLQSLKPTIPSVTRKPDNLWNYNKQREKLKFLTEQPVCSCGAGRDISFIYDNIPDKPQSKQVPSKYDMSAIRAPEEIIEQPIQLPDTLVPDEFHVVKNRGVWPVKVNENKYTTIPEEHLNHITVFPSMKPTGRNEVIQLKHTMDALLGRVGADAVDENGPTQIHNLLEIIKQEQDIYNIIFHEIIRQVTVECKERGEVLAKLRERYANLLSRVPRQIKSLHEEMVAQRALDRRLTEELTQFKSTIAMLTEELSEIREHDKKISDSASNYQKDLEAALAESQKNASLLTEYHELYELQRKRLEKVVESLTEERETWCNAAHSIAMKIIMENKLNTSKRVNLTERSWFKIARHFSILLSDRDTKAVSEIQKLAEQWREILQDYYNDLMTKEDETKKNLTRVLSGFQQIEHALLTSAFDSEKNFKQTPELKKSVGILSDVKHWLELLNKEAEKLTGDTILIYEERVRKAEGILTRWMELTSKLISRHHSLLESQKKLETISHDKLNSSIKKLHHQFQLRSHGDNGLAKYIISVNNGLDVWQQKLEDHVNSHRTDTLSKKSLKRMSDNEWVQFQQAMEEWIVTIRRAIRTIGSNCIENDESLRSTKESSSNNEIVDYDMLLNNIHEWLGALSHYVENQDACMIDQISALHSSMVHWLVQVLIRLAPDRAELSEEAKQVIYFSSASTEKLMETMDSLVMKIENFTKILISCCNVIATEEMIEKQKLKIENADKEVQNLKALQNECNEWIHSSKILINELTNDYSHTLDQDARQSEEPGVDLESDDETVNDGKSNRTQVIKVVTPPYQRRVDVAKSDKTGKDSSLYEVLGQDRNTQRKILRNINMNSSPESDSKSDGTNQKLVFEAYKTIERLQEQLVHTEERAQAAESRVSELEYQLKEALDRIRTFDRSSDLDMDLQDISQLNKSEVNQSQKLTVSDTAALSTSPKLTRKTKEKSKKQKK